MTRRHARRVLRRYAESPRPASRTGRAGSVRREVRREDRRRLHRHVAGLVAARRAWAERLLNMLMSPVMRGLRRVDVDDESLHRLRRAAEQGPLVFLPAHRSYIDSLVLASALQDAGLDQPWRLAGENLSFWPLGPIARRSGTVFIRRDFGFDPTYHLALRCHLADLLARAQSLEWYPEAGRSRTGRLRRLRNGLPRILVAAYLDSGAVDVHVVPVSIVYDASPDMESVTELDAGAAKQPEGLRALTRYLRDAGATGPHSAWVSFGEPLSLRELTDAAPTEWSAVRTLTQQVASGLRDATQVTAESLLALAIPPDLREACDTAALGEQTLALLDYATTRQIPLCRNTRIEDALEGMIRTRILSLGPTGFTVREGRQRMLAYHRNVAEHWFLPRAAAELVAAGAVTPHRISGLLAPLDTCSATEAFERRVEAELTSLADNWRQQPFLLAPRLLGPVFEAYLEVAAAPVAAAPVAADPAADDPPACEPAAEPPSGSAELREAAIAMLAAEGLREPQADETARNTYLAELSRLLDRTRELAALDVSRYSRYSRTADVRR